MVDPLRARIPDDALSQPTRARLFILLGELGQPAATAELARSLGLHPNGVRLHLDRLVRDGLVVRGGVSPSRGRPRHMWSIAPDASPAGLAPSAYADLARWLARALGPGSPRGLRGIEATGREIGRELAARRGGAGEEAFAAALTALGFHPQLRAGAARRVEISLRNCPYRDAVVESQAVTCTLHRGITRGLLDVMTPGARLAGFEPRDPERAGCLIRLTGIAVS